MRDSNPTTDLSLIEIYGMSKPWQRRLALALTLFIWWGLAMSSCYILVYLNNSEIADQIGLVLWSTLVVDYTVRGECYLKTLAFKLFIYTPLGVLYEKDKRTIRRVHSELIEQCKSCRLADFLRYAPFNPKLLSQSYLPLFLNQSKGDLAAWTRDINHLRLLADFMNQVQLAKVVADQEMVREE